MAVELISLSDVAERIGRKKATLNNWVHLGRELGPKFFRVGGKQMVTVEDFNEYIMNCKEGKKC